MEINQLIELCPEYEEDILVFDDYIKQILKRREEEEVAFEWHIRTYPPEIKKYFYELLQVK